MSYDANVYYHPEKSGLTTTGEVDFSSGCYEFDYTVVWRDASGQLYYADDSGCSCPSPFETTGMDDLTPCTLADLQAHLEKRVAEDAYDGNKDRCAGEVVELLGRVRKPPTVAATVENGETR